MREPATHSQANPSPSLRKVRSKPAQPAKTAPRITDQALTEVDGLDPTHPNTPTTEPANIDTAQVDAPDTATHSSDTPDTWQLPVHNPWLMTDASASLQVLPRVDSGDISNSSWLKSMVGISQSTGLPIMLGTAAVVGIGASHTLKGIHPPVVRPQVMAIDASAANDTITLRFDHALNPSELPLLSQFTVTQGASQFALDGLRLSNDGLELVLHLAADLSASPMSLRYVGDGVVLANFIQGVVADGYISGARIYIDTNGDGIAQPNEDSGVTSNADGTFLLSSNLPTAPLIAVGGVNMDTGLAQISPLLAPADALVVNPLTSLLQEVIRQTGGSAQTASAQVSRALGLPTGLNLSTYNPLAEQNSTSLGAQKVAAQINNLLHLGSSGNDTRATDIWHAIGNTIISHSSTSPLDLAEHTTLLQMLSSALGNDSIVADIALANTAIQQSESLSQISNAQASLSIYNHLQSSISTQDNSTPEATALLMGAGSNNIIHLMSGTKVSVTGRTAFGTLMRIQLAEGIERETTAPENGTWRYVLTDEDIRALPQGAQTFQVWTVAPTGNTSSPVPIEVFVDTTAPAFSASLMSSGNMTGGQWVSADPTPSFTINTEPGAVLALRDGHGSVQYLQPDSDGLVTAALSDTQGLHKISLWVNDAHGNSSNIQTLNYWLDNLPPTVKVDMGPEPLMPSTGNVSQQGQNSRIVSFNFDQAPLNTLSDNNHLQYLEVRGGQLSGFSAVSQPSGGSWTQTANFTPTADSASGSITVNAGWLSDSVGNTSQIASANLVVLPALAPTPDDPHIIAAVVTLLSNELGELPFVVDLTRLAGWLIQHAYIDWSNEQQTFSVGFTDSSAPLYIPIRTDLGWQGLSFDVTGSSEPALYINTEGRVSGGIDDAGSFYLLTGTSGTHISMDISVDIPNDLRLAGTLGPLTIAAENMAPNTATHTQNGLIPDAAITATLSLVDPGTGNGADGRLTWEEMNANIATPISLVNVSAEAVSHLNFETSAQMHTGLRSVDAMLPAFRVNIQGAQHITGSVGANNSLSYAVDLGLINTRITSDVLSDFVIPTLTFANNQIINPAFSLIAFLESPLLTSSQTYTAPHREPPNWYDVIGWAQYAVDTAIDSVREATSSGINAVIQSIFGMLDGDADGQVTVLELITRPIDILYNLVYGLYLGPAGSVAAGMELDPEIRAKMDTFLEAHPLFIQKAQVIVDLHKTADDLRSILSKIHQFQDLVTELTGMSQSEQNNWIDKMGELGGIPLGDLRTSISGHVGDPVNTLNSTHTTPLMSTEEALKLLLGDSTGHRIYAQLDELGVDLPFLSNNHLLADFVTGKTADLVTVDLNLPTISFNFAHELMPTIEALASFFSGGTSNAFFKGLEVLAKFNLAFTGGFTIHPNIEVGLDTWGVNQWMDSGMQLNAAALGQLLNNFYMDDHVITALDGQITDLPELSLSGNMGLLGGATFGSAFAGAHTSLAVWLQAQGVLDLNDPNGDGKVRWEELLQEVFHPVDIQLDELGIGISAGAEAWLDLSQPIPPGSGFISSSLASIGSSVLQFLAPNKYAVALPDLNLYFPLVGDSHTVV